jgi:histidine biosynthesis protein
MDIIDWDAPPDFEMIPSLAVMGMSAVWVKGKMYNQLSMGGVPIPVVGLAGELLDRFDKLHYLDILGIRKGTVEWNLVQTVTDKKGDVWIDTGIIYSDSVIDAIMAGAESAVISTKMISSLEEIASCLELTENVILQIDHDGAIVSKDKRIRNMPPGELVEEMTSFGLGRFIIDDIRDSRETVSRELIMEVLKAAPDEAKVYAGSLELGEMEGLADAGLDGAIISTSRLIEGLD